MTVLHNAVSFEAKNRFYVTSMRGSSPYPQRTLCFKRNLYVLFFVEKKEPKKATVKRYTPRLTDTTLCNDSTTVASAVNSLCTPIVTTNSQTNEPQILVNLIQTIHQCIAGKTHLFKHAVNISRRIMVVCVEWVNRNAIG